MTGAYSFPGKKNIGEKDTNLEKKIQRKMGLKIENLHKYSFPPNFLYMLYQKKLGEWKVNFSWENKNTNCIFDFLNFWKKNTDVPKNECLTEHQLFRGKKIAIPLKYGF